MIGSYILISVLTLCLVCITAIHIGYVKRIHTRFTNINLAYLLSMYVSAMNSIAMTDPPIESIPAGSQTEDPTLINTIAGAVTDYLQTWHWALSYMFTASRLPVMQINLSVSHQGTYLDSVGNQVAYAFQVSVQANDHLQSFPLIVSNSDVDQVVGKMRYHSDKLQLLVNHFMRRDNGGVEA